MTRPTTYPEWASVLQNDPVTGVQNKVEPTDSFKQTGVNRNEAPARPYLNYEFDLIARWVEYLDVSTSSGKVNLSSGTAVVTIPDQGTTNYKVAVTPKANVGSFWVTNDSNTQFTIHTSTSTSSDVDWILVNNL